MKPMFAIILAIVIVLVIVVVGYSYKSISDRNKLIADTQKDIQTANTIEYRSLKCISNCPLETDNQSKVVFETACINKCAKDNPIPQAVIKKFFGQLIMESDEHRVCIKMVDSTVNYTKYKECLVDLLLKLPEKYAYLKGV
jgi:hypothetical protein